LALVTAAPYADPSAPGTIQTPVSEIVKGVLPAPAPKVESAPKSKVAPKVKAPKKEAAPKAEKPVAAKKKAAPKKVKKGDYDLDLQERVAQEEAVAAEDAADAKAAKEVSYVGCMVYAYVYLYEAVAVLVGSLVIWHRRLYHITCQLFLIYMN